MRSAVTPSPASRHEPDYRAIFESAPGLSTTMHHILIHTPIFLIIVTHFFKINIIRVPPKLNTIVFDK